MNLTSRRDFLHRSAAAVALAGHLPHISGARRKEKLGFALVGLGNLSTNQLAPAFARSQFCRLAGIVTGTPAKAARWKERYGIPDRSIYNYDTMDRMRDNPDIDVVYVVTPNALHAEHTIKAARAGKHVLCEKPMEVSGERCQAMIDECRRTGRMLAVAYRCQFEPHHLELVRLAREKTFGDLRLIDAGFGFPIGDPTQWRLNRSLSGGGPLMDVGIYALQSARMITGQEPVSVSATTTKTDPVKFRDVEETMSFQLTFPGAVMASCLTSYKFGINRVTAIADRGRFGLEPAYNYDAPHGFRSDGQPLAFTPVDVFAAEMDDFAQCIQAGRPTKVPGEEGLRDIRIMTATYEAARTGRTVPLG